MKMMRMMRMMIAMYFSCLANSTPTAPSTSSEDFLTREGVLSVRGCEVIRMEDEDGVSLNDPSNPDDRAKRAGRRRTVSVRLDPTQYQRDMELVALGEIANP